MALVISGCTYNSDTLGPIICENEGERDGDRECRGGVWVSLAENPPEEMGLDMDMAPGEEMNPPLDMEDMMPPVDMPPVDMCIPETQLELCTDRCESITVTNRCGSSQTLDCGACGGDSTCDADGFCQTCDPFDIETFCTDNGFDCGLHDPPEGSCQTEPFVCGTCTGTDVCNADTNICEGCTPEPDAQVCLELEAFCRSAPIRLTDSCTMSERSLDCSGCPYSSNAAKDVEPGTGPYANPDPTDIAKPANDLIGLVYWLNPDIGFDAQSGWDNQSLNANTPGAASLTGAVDVVPDDARVNDHAMVRIDEQGFIELDIDNDVDEFSLLMVFRTDFVSGTATTAPWNMQPTLFGYDSMMAGDPVFGVAMLQSGELVYGPAAMNEDVAFTSMTPYLGDELHVLHVERKPGASATEGAVRIFVDGELIADDVAARGGTIAMPGNFRVGAQTDPANAMVRAGWAGDVGDIIYYENSSDADREMALMTSMALKYGITFDIPLEYKLSGTLTVFDTTPEDGFDHHIAALMRQDQVGIHQGRARSSEPGAILTITSGEFLDEFTDLVRNACAIAIASDDGNPQTTLPAISIDDDYEVIPIGRKWRMDGVSITRQTFNLSFDASLLPDVDTLIVSDTPDFTGSLEFYQVKLVDNNGELTRAVALQLDDGAMPTRRYFTFGQLELK